MKGARRLSADISGSVAPLVALSIIALTAAGGIAFDYSRMAGMHTELLDAADQAALAAASQLDGQSGACVRAVAAASGLLSNNALFSNTSVGPGITVDSTAPTACAGNTYVKFYQSWNYGTDAPGTAANSDANAKVVVVTVNSKTARFALTPIVKMFTADLKATAAASLGTAICKTPPVMICNPQEGSDPTFTTANYIGKGLKLVSVGNGNGSWAPGNFGYLNSSGGSNGAPGLREALGWNTPPGNCLAQSGVDTKPGASVTVTDALNTRFDIFDNGQSCPSGGACGVAADVIKDVVRPGNSNNCAYGNNGQVWQLATNYYGSGNYPSASAVPAALPTGTTPGAMGTPRDMCHLANSGVAGACTTAVGDGAWDRDAYFRTNYLRTTAGVGGAAGTRWSSANWQAQTGLSPSVAVTASNYASRYNVYKWELTNAGLTKDGVVVLASRVVSGNGANAVTAWGAPQCGTTPTGTNAPDRRRISMAVINCTANSVNGNSTNVPVVKWVDLFLTEPSINRERTNAGDIYAEVIGETATAGGGNSAQVVRHDKPYLIQ